jgi:hypothetical protein
VYLKDFKRGQPPQEGGRALFELFGYLRSAATSNRPAAPASQPEPRLERQRLELQPVPELGPQLVLVLLALPVLELALLPPP